MAESLAEKVYLRKATGMVRGYSMWDMFVMNGNGVAPGAMLAAIFVVMGAFYPGSNVFYALLIAAPFVMCFALSYGILAACMPRSGGDYIFGSRVVHPVWGLAGSFMYNVAHFVADAATPIFALQYLLPVTIGLTMPDNPGAQAFAAWLKTPAVVLLGGTILLALACGIAIIGRTVWRATNYLYFILGTVGCVVAIGVLAIYTPTGFQNAFNSYAAQYGTSFSDIMVRAQAAGWTATPVAFLPTMAAILYFYLYIFCAWPVYMGGEVKSGDKALPLSIIYSSIFGLVIALVTAGLFYNVIGYDWISAASYLAYNAPSSYPLPYVPELYTLVSILANNPIPTFLVGIGATLWTVSWLFNDNILVSRTFFAWSFDRIFPTRLATIHPRFKTPAAALIAAFLITEAFLFIEMFTSIIGVLMNVALLCSLSYLPAQFSCFLLPLRRKDLWEKGPSWTRIKIGPVPLASIVGLVSGVFLTMLIVALVFIYPALGGPVNFYSLALLLTVYIICIAMYYGARYYHLKKEGIDVAWAFKEIPPA